MYPARDSPVTSSPDGNMFFLVEISDARLEMGNLFKGPLIFFPRLDTRNDDLEKVGILL